MILAAAERARRELPLGLLVEAHEEHDLDRLAGAAGRAVLAYQEALGSTYGTPSPRRRGAAMPERKPDLIDLLTGVQVAAGKEGSLALRAAFDDRSPAVLESIRAQAAALVVEVSTETQAALRSAISRAYVAGKAPRVFAQEIRGIVGLTRAHALAVERLYERLTKRGVSAAEIAKKRAAYTEKLHRYRALNIARTETIRAANLGLEEGWKQAQEAGRLKGAKKKWLVTDDDRLCPICAPMAGLLADVGKPYVTPDGDEIQGPPLHPSCRCAQGIASVPIAEPATDGGGAPPVDLGTAAPADPAAVPVFGPPARLSWDDFGVKLPKDKARRELAEEALQVLNTMPPRAREAYIAVLKKIPRVEFEVATDSTKDMRALGRMGARVGFGQKPQLDRMMLHLSRPSEEHAQWSALHVAEHKRLMGLPRAGTGNSYIQGMTDWQKANPEPSRWRLATPEEVGPTLVHELTHALDFDAGGGGIGAYGLTHRLEKDGIPTEVWRAYYRGEVDVLPGGKVRAWAGAKPDGMFAYAASKREERITELARLYFTGSHPADSWVNVSADAGRRMTPEEWRLAYPRLAAWMEKLF